MTSMNSIRIAKEVKEKIESVPDVKDVGIYKELGQPNLLIEVDRANAAAVGLTVQEVLDMVSAALGGKVVSQIIEGDRHFALQVSFPYEYRKEPEKIATIPIVLPNGGIVPLSRVARYQIRYGASFIYRENFKRYIPIKFSVVSKDLGGNGSEGPERRWPRSRSRKGISWNGAAYSTRCKRLFGDSTSPSPCPFSSSSSFYTYSMEI